MAPASFTVARSTVVAADPTVIHPLIDDFRQWPQWSPWEGVDPQLDRQYTGPDRGVGARYEWRGNRKAGQGSMTITASDPSRVVLDLHFLKPFASSSVATFLLVGTGDGTEVTWTMQGENRGLAKVFGRFISMDKLVGGDFEKGLAALKSVAEQRG